jgi:hypothetical protein
MDDFLVTAYYADGIVVHDAKNPDKLVEVAYFDTSPNFSGGGYNGSWGAYPFLPSGVILASDIEEGLYILEIDYMRAAFLEGLVTSEAAGTPLFNAQVEIIGTGLVTQTAFDGTYEFGTLLSGTFDLEFSKPGYITQVITNVEIINGEIAIANAELETLAVGVTDTDEKNDLMSLYPNPFKETITLEYDLPDDFYGQQWISVYNLLGEKVRDIILNGKGGKIRFGEGLPSGVYFVKLDDKGSNIRTEKIVKR